jgi:hypothetical protein
LRTELTAIELYHFCPSNAKNLSINAALVNNLCIQPHYNLQHISRIDQSRKKTLTEAIATKEPLAVGILITTSLKKKQADAVIAGAIRCSGSVVDKISCGTP